jgi:hypothetical protein
LEKLLWEKATRQITKDLGVSDKAVEKHCRKLALKKPPRRYWGKNRRKKASPRILYSAVFLIFNQAGSWCCTHQPAGWRRVTRVPLIGSCLRIFHSSDKERAALKSIFP